MSSSAHVVSTAEPQVVIPRRANVQICDVLVAAFDVVA